MPINTDIGGCTAPRYSLPRTLAAGLKEDAS